MPMSSIVECFGCQLQVGSLVYRVVFSPDCLVAVGSLVAAFRPVIASTTADTPLAIVSV